jgi:Ni/Fe-hydrogenase subunit HybB-like protein
MGVVIPLVMLLFHRIRHSVGGLFTAATLVVLGVVLNRINVFLVAYTPLYGKTSYFPSIFEIMLTVGLIAALVLVYRAIVMIFPVISVPAAER